MNWTNLILEIMRKVLFPKKASHRFTSRRLYWLSSCSATNTKHKQSMLVDTCYISRLATTKYTSNKSSVHTHALALNPTTDSDNICTLPTTTNDANNSNKHTICIRDQLNWKFPLLLCLTYGPTDRPTSLCVITPICFC